MNINDTQKKIIDGVLKKYDALLDELNGINPSYISDSEYVEIWRGRKTLENDLYSKIQEYNLDKKYPRLPIGGWNVPNNNKGV
jgi:hypothetical protein